jgi:hypothetical protein
MNDELQFSSYLDERTETRPRAQKAATPTIRLIGRCDEAASLPAISLAVSCRGPKIGADVKAKGQGQLSE